MNIKTVRDLMTAVRQGKYTSLGSYPLFATERNTTMKTLSLAIVALLLSAPVHAADDKPSVCMTFEEVSTSKGAAAICLDGKSPRLFTEYAIVTTKRGAVLLGWR